MQILKQQANRCIGTSSKAQFTVGKIDAGMAVLLTNENQLIEFPSILLPPGVKSGSVVLINVANDNEEELRRKNSFEMLQDAIFREFGSNEPKDPVIKVRSVTQTSAVIEWETLEISKSKLLGLILYKNGHRLPIPLPTTLEVANKNNYCKVSGLDLDHEYEFYLEMCTSSGEYKSNSVSLKTHTLDNLTGICVSFGLFEEPRNTNNEDSYSDENQNNPEIDQLKSVIERIGARWCPDINIDVTHFICKIPSGDKYELADAYNIPVVKPEWLLACEADRKLQPAISYYISK
ncbi:hypothetical protein BB558_000232 [Smittium angustum]|uniref:BRCT domain-containing protein n=1 Tax=Smittium angustum TaxID=133377 RepID=A0A2U1JER4_SMIAN|nr:hypothetical protein BB558_000232 [Smittium angustum]